MQRLADELLVPLVFLRRFILSFLGIALAERSARHRGHAVHELRLEQDVGVRKHAIL